MGTIKKHVTGDLTIFKITGSLEPDDVLQALQDLYSHEPTKNILWDLTDATVRQFTLDNVSRLASFVTRFKNTREGGKTAIVSPQDLEFGVGRMFDAFAEIKEVKFEVRVFRDFQAATDWLGMNIPPTEPNTPQS